MKEYRKKSRSNSSKRNSQRQELEVNLPLVCVITAILVVAIYAVVFLPPLRNSTIGVLLYDRGFTQIVVMILAGMVIATTILKYLQIKPEYSALNKIWIAEHIPLEQADSPEVDYLRERLMSEGSLVARRCARVISAYVKSGDRSIANEFALDDSTFYQSASESSYSFPRILVWAIPLLGFIGTVVGISKAVSGFSGFLENAADVEQIKEGIGTVTSGLAVAFDTTLLALFLSVVVMIPLVLVERYESRLLLGIDMFINDKLIPRLKGKNIVTQNNSNLDPETINNAVKNAIDEHFPSPENLVTPAQQYAEKAASNLARNFLQEIGKVQNVTSQVISQVTDVRNLAYSDRQHFMEFFVKQQQANQQAILQFQTIAEEIKNKNAYLANGLHVQTKEIGYHLEKAAKTLESRIVSLEQSASKIGELKEWQKSLDDSLRSLEKTAQLENVLEGVKENLNQLRPVLKELNKPRRIVLVEQENGNNGSNILQKRTVK